MACPFVFLRFIDDNASRDCRVLKWSESTEQTCDLVFLVSSVDIVVTPGGPGFSGCGIKSGAPALSCSVFHNLIEDMCKF